MKKQQPDRFDRIVEREFGKPYFMADGPLNRRMVKLLRRQHRAYVRIVKHATRWRTTISMQSMTTEQDGDWIERDILLVALAEYAKGKGKP